MGTRTFSPVRVKPHGIIKLCRQSTELYDHNVLAKRSLVHTSILFSSIDPRQIVPDGSQYNLGQPYLGRHASTFVRLE